MEPLTAQPSTLKRSFDGVDPNYTIAECFDWISRQMDQRLLAKQENEVLLLTHEESRKLSVKKNLCSYETTGKKTRWINANHLFYGDKNGNLVDSGITRTGTPHKVKMFYSWRPRPTQR